MPQRASHAALLPLHDRLRDLLPRIKSKIIQALGDEAGALLNQSADELGYLEDGEIAVASEYELGLIADYAYFDRLRDGTTVVERYAASASPSDPHEAALLAGLGRSRCGMFLVHTVEAGVGVGVADLIGSRTGFVVDPRIASVAAEGTVFATRLVDLPELTIAAGTAFPLDQLAQDEVEEDLGDAFPGRPRSSLRNLPPAERAEVNRIVTGALIEAMDWQLQRIANQLAAEEGELDRPAGPPPQSATSTGRPPRGQRPKPPRPSRKKGKRRS